MKKSQQSALRLLAVTTLVIIASAGTAVTAQAAYIVNATETGGDVVFSGSGSLDLTAWQFFGQNNLSGTVNTSNNIIIGPASSALALSDIYHLPANFSGPSSIGPNANQVTSATSAAGDITTGIEWSGPALTVPGGYSTGEALSGSMVITGHTFATLGVTPGSYEWTWGSGATADSFTLNVGAVPIPAAVWLFGSGLLGLIGVARRKKA